MAEHVPIPLRRWLIRLGMASAARLSTDEASEFVAAMEPLLAVHFPPAAFTFASLEHVASQCKFLPAYGEITEHLGEWWRRDRKLPTLPYEPPQPAEPHTAEERAHASWVASQAIASLRSSEQPHYAYRKPTPRYLTREQLDQAYKQAGLKSPYERAS